MGFFGSIGSMMSNPDYKRFVQFGRAWQAGWRPNNYSMSDGVSDWKQQFQNWYNSYGSTYDVNEALNYWNNLREKEYDSSVFDGLQINLPIMAGTSKGFGVGDVVGLGNLGLSALNYYQQSQLAKAQLAQVQANNALSYQMFVEGNRYNSAEAEAAFRRSFDASKYTTQAGLMRNAGLNPAMMYGEGSTISPPSSPSASSQAASPLQSGIGVNAPVFDILGFANAFKALADAKKAGAETKSIESLLAEQVKDLQLRNDYQEILNSYQGKKSATEIAKMIQDIEKQYVEIDNLIKEGNLTEAQTRLTDVQEQIAQENKGLAKAERELREALAEKREEYTTNILNQQKEEIETTKKQGNMYVQQGKAAIMQGEAALKSAAAALMQGQAALSNAEVNRLNGEAQRDLWQKEGLKVDALRQMTDAQKFELCQKIAGALVTSGGEVHVDGVKQEWMQNALMREMYNVTRQQGADYWNPFKYVGHVFGGSVGVTKMVK